MSHLDKWQKKIGGFFHYKKSALRSLQSALLVLSLFSDRFEQFL